MAHRAGIQLYSTIIPVDGWSGWPLLAVGAGLAMALPAAGLVVLAGIAGGTVLGFALIHLRGN
jgi:hypothetical protein